MYNNVRLFGGGMLIQKIAFAKPSPSEDDDVGQLNGPSFLIAHVPISHEKDSTSKPEHNDMIVRYHKMEGKHLSCFVALLLGVLIFKMHIFPAAGDQDEDIPHNE
ncbi:hypothetical protein ACLKA7_003454 [Drosophila subpalustris]